MDAVPSTLNAHINVLELISELSIHGIFHFWKIYAEYNFHLFEENRSAACHQMNVS